MKILCEYSRGGSAPVRSGWGRALAAAGHEFAFYDPEGKSAFDAFDEFFPAGQEEGVYLGTTYGDPAVYKCLRARPWLKVGLFASAWGPLADSLDGKKYPIVRVTDQEKRLVESLKREAGKPDFVFVHVTQKYLEATMGGWRSAGVTPAGVLNGFDSVLFAGAKARPELACDWGFVGSRWPYKGRNIDRFLFPLCSPDGGLAGKIFGQGGWGELPQWLGSCTDDQQRDLFVSAAVCPNVSEPHSTDLGFDVVERPFKVLGAGGFCVSDHVDELREIFPPDELPTARTPEEFLALVRHYARHPQERLPMMTRARQTVLAGHTYAHRVAQMFELFGLPQEGRKCLDACERLWKQSGTSGPAAA